LQTQKRFTPVASRIEKVPIESMHCLPYSSRLLGIDEYSTAERVYVSPLLMSYSPLLLSVTVKGITVEA